MDSISKKGKKKGYMAHLIHGEIDFMISKAYFYWRISVGGDYQYFDAQEENAINFCDTDEAQEMGITFDNSRVIKDACSGKDFNRPGWKELEKNIQPGEAIIFRDMSRFSRDIESGNEMYEKLSRKGVHLIFINERHLDNDISISAARHMLDVEDALNKAQIEREKRASGASKGIAARKKRGGKVGRPKGTSGINEKGRKAREYTRIHYKKFGGDMTEQQIADKFGFNRHTIGYIVKEIMGAQNKAAVQPYVLPPVDSEDCPF